MAKKCIQQTVTGEKAKIRKYTSENSFNKDWRVSHHVATSSELTSSMLMNFEAEFTFNYELVH